MMSLLTLLWICGWLAGMSMRALHYGRVVFLDLVVMAMFSWLGTLLAMCECSATVELWSSNKPPVRRHPLMQNYQKGRRR